MKKKFYEQPSCDVVELSTESIMALSGADAGGSGTDMPWGVNQMDNPMYFPWLKNEESEE